MPSWLGGRAKADKGYVKVDALDVDALEQADEDAKIRASVKACPSSSIEWPEFNERLDRRVFFSWFHPLIKLGAKVSWDAPSPPPLISFAGAS